MNINELTLKNITEWPLTIKCFFILGLNFLIIALGYGFIVHGIWLKHSDLKAQELALKVELINKHFHCLNLTKFQQQLQAINDKLTFMLMQLPQKQKIPALLEKISKAGGDSGLHFKLFAPQPEIIHDFYIELPIKIIVVGGYFQLTTFLNQIAKMQQMITMQEFKVHKKMLVTTTDDLVVHITAKIYRSRST